MKESACAKNNHGSSLLAKAAALAVTRLNSARGVASASRHHMKRQSYQLPLRASLLIS